MSVSTSDLFYVLSLSASLVAVILLTMAAYYLVVEPVRQRRRVNRRLQESGEEYLRRVKILKERSGNLTDGRLKVFEKILGAERLARIQRQMLQADIYLDIPTFLIRVFLLGFLGFLVGFFGFRSALLGLLLGSGISLLPFCFMSWKGRRKAQKFEVQMPDAMELLSRSLRAGHTLPSAIELLGEEMADPMGTEMKIVYEEQRFGISMTEALFQMLQRVDSMDLRYFVSAVLIQQDTGGNLAELMENIARIIRNRINFRAKVRGLTAIGRLSAKVMIVVPILAFFALMVVAHQYETVLITTATGRQMLVAGIVMLFIGSYMLKKIIDSVEA
jgi:tight adherence protein B